MALRQTKSERAPGVARTTGHAGPEGIPDDGHKTNTIRACLDRPAEVAAVLLDYLSSRLNRSGLEYAQQPVEVCGGWETYTYSFQLKNDAGLPESYTRPLILRAYSCCEGLPRARYEFAVQDCLAELNYPLPASLLLEEDCSYFGGPFLVSRRIEGPTLLRSALDKPWMVCAFAARMAAVQARLHRLPARNFPARPGGDFLSRTLDRMTRVVGHVRLNGLRPGLEWLCAHRPPAPRHPCIVHLDLHPLNLLHDGAGGLVVIDWTEADIADPHADVAQTAMTLECMAEDHPSRYDRFWVGVGRWLFALWYQYAYRSRLPLDSERLGYYRALAAFRRLCHYGHWLHSGPTMDGRKPCAIHHLQPDHIHVVERYFQKWSGVPVALAPRGLALVPEPLVV